MKKKHSLLNIVKKLTEGVVAKNISWSTVKAAKNKDVLDKPRQRDERPELYSLQESCRVLQSSYDDLYADDDDDVCDSETDSVSSGISATQSDSVDGALNHSFSSESAAVVSDVKTIEDTRSVDTGISDDSSSNSAAAGPLSRSSTPNSDATASDVKDGDAMSDTDTAASGSDSDEPCTSEDESDLYAPEAWKSYYQRLEEIGRTMKNREGWPKFDAVFMTSAIDGDGVFDIKVNRFCRFTVKHFSLIRLLFKISRSCI